MGVYLADDTSRKATNDTLNLERRKKVTKIEAIASEPIRLVAGANAVVTISGWTRSFQRERVFAKVVL